MDDPREDLEQLLARALPGPLGNRDEESSFVDFELEPGRRVGAFELIARIAHGGQGQVWRAHQSSVDRVVALKFLRSDRVTERGLRLLDREARAGGRLAHPSIVRVIDYGKEGELAWIAMEYVEGERTLRDLILDVGSRSEPPAEYDRMVASFIAEVADAMQAAHDAQVVHCDLKPQNILLGPTKRPLVTDFGLARLIDESLSESTSPGGTFWYMSPEQVRASEKLGYATDIFSLGVVLYEMLGLRRPFEGDTGVQVTTKILREEPPALRKIRSRIPAELEAICGKALEKEPGQRYGSMAEFRDDLRRFLRGEPVLARPPGPARRAARWVRRHPSTVVAFILIVLTAMSIVGGERLVRAARIEQEAEKERIFAELEPLYIYDEAWASRMTDRVGVEDPDDAANRARELLDILDRLNWPVGVSTPPKDKRPHDVFSEDAPRLRDALFFLGVQLAKSGAPLTLSAMEDAPPTYALDQDGALDKDHRVRWQRTHREFPELVAAWPGVHAWMRWWCENPQELAALDEWTSYWFQGDLQPDQWGPHQMELMSPWMLELLGDLVRESSKLPQSADEKRQRLLLQRELYTRALEGEPERIRCLHHLQLISTSEGRKEEQLFHAARMAGLRPDWSTAAYQIANYLYATGERRLARINFARTIELDPEQIQAYAMLVYCLEDQFEMLEVLERALGREKRSYLVYGFYNMWAPFDDGEWNSKAIEANYEAIEHYPRTQNGFFYRAQAERLAHGGLWTEMEEVIAEFRELWPESYQGPEMIAIYALDRFERGNPGDPALIDRAAEAAVEAIDAGGGLSCELLLAEARRLQGRESEALELLAPHATNPDAREVLHRVAKSDDAAAAESARASLAGEGLTLDGQFPVVDAFHLAVDPEWSLRSAIEVPKPNAAHVSMESDGFYVGSAKGPCGSGLYHVDWTGRYKFMGGLEGISGVLAGPEPRTAFASLSGAGDVHRFERDTLDTPKWIGEFAPSDDDPQGMALVPTGYAGPFLREGEALVADSGYRGTVGIWRWDPLDASVTPRRVLSTVDHLWNPVDVAVNRDRILIADRQNHVGRLYDVTEDGLVPLVQRYGKLAGVAFDPRDDSVLVLEDRGRVRRLDLDSNELTTVFDAIPGAGAGDVAGIDLSRDGSRLLISAETANLVYVFTRD